MNPGVHTMQGFIGQKTIPCFRIAFLEHIFLSLSQWYPSRVRRMSVTFSHSSTNATTPLSFVFVSFSMWQAGEWSPAGCFRHFAVDNRTSFLYNIMCNCQGEVFSEFLSSNFLSSFPNICQIREPRKVEFFQITFLHSMDSHCVCSNDCTQFNTDREFV